MVTSRRMWVYVGFLGATALALACLVLPKWPITDPWPIAALVLLTLALANMEIELPFAVSLSFIFASIFAGVLYSGPVAGGLLGFVGAVSIQEIRERKAVVLLLCNLSQLSIAGLCAGWMFVTLGGQPMQAAGAAPMSLGSGLLAPAAAVMTFFVLNLLFVGIALILKTGSSVRDTIGILGPGSYWVSLLVLALLGYVMALLISASSWLGLLLLVLPFVAARRTFRVYVELSEAYLSTVRSLVTAIEAKDPYTRGHSERVAVFARQLGERLALPRTDLDLLERAGLLHDVGKIGIDLDTLTSPARLTPEEVRAIRQHPVSGSELVRDVEFLADVVPIVQYHHERIDGAGYPDGLVGERIPPLARILAVADAYDAMTSDRAYRPRLSQDEALAEIARVAGTQLDRTMALQFSAMIAQAEQVEGEA